MFFVDCFEELLFVVFLGGDEVEFGYFLEIIQLCFGYIFEVVLEGVMVIVGGNNVGKLMVLREVMNFVFEGLWMFR